MNDDRANERLRSFLEGLHRLFQFQDCKVIDVNTRGSTGDAPLKVAVVREDLTAVKDLLKAGADPNIQGEDDYTPRFNMRHRMVTWKLSAFYPLMGLLKN